MLSSQFYSWVGFIPKLKYIEYRLCLYENVGNIVIETIVLNEKVAIL